MKNIKPRFIMILLWFLGCGHLATIHEVHTYRIHPITGTHCLDVYDGNHYIGTTQGSQLDKFLKRYHKNKF